MLMKTPSRGARILRAIVAFLENSPSKKHTPLERQRLIWKRISSYRTLLTPEQRELYEALGVSLDAGNRLQPEHEDKLLEMDEDIEGKVAW